MLKYRIYIRNPGDNQYVNLNWYIETHTPLVVGKHTTPKQYRTVCMINKIEHKGGLRVYLTRKTKSKWRYS